MRASLVRRLIHLHCGGSCAWQDFCMVDGESLLSQFAGASQESRPQQHGRAVQLPVIRVFGSTARGQKACVHEHGVMHVNLLLDLCHWKSMPEAILTRICGGMARYTHTSTFGSMIRKTVVAGERLLRCNRC